MLLSNTTELQPAAALLWDRFYTMYTKQRLPHSLLLIGPEFARPLDLAYQMANTLLCSQEQKPCGQCKSCRLLQAREHPDIYHLKPEQPNGIIKIDQIRSLHNIVFTSPQLANRRVVIINPAERMNAAAANALLKLLEEPPPCVIFFLIAEHISTLPATILSRCQQWRFSCAETLKADYLTLAQEYSDTSDKGTLFKHLPTIIEDLMELVTDKLSICTVAKKWSSYELNSLMWLIYLLNSQMIAYQLNGCRGENDWTQQLYQLSHYFRIIDLFKQLDQINKIIKNLQQNVALNEVLVLENLLLGYTVSR